MTSPQFAKVIVDAPLPELDYAVGGGVLPRVGDRVLVPLGARKVVGIVTGLADTTEVPAGKIKSVLRVFNEVKPLRAEWLKTMAFAADYYLRARGEAALSALPPFFRLPATPAYEKRLEKLRELKTKKIAYEPAPVLNDEQQAAADAVSSSTGYAPFLLFGVTGSGKTFMFQLLEEMPELKDLCFFNYCASDMTPNGFSGDDISNVFSKYERMARQKMKKGENGLQMPLGIIFLDEMDKIIGMSNTDSNGEDCNAIVTAQLLTAIAGTQNYGNVDTSKILFIMAGAFEELENSRKKKREEHGIGFAVNASAKEKENSMTGYDLREELEEIGVSKQFLGRVPYIVHMDRLSRAQLRQILVDKEHGVFGKKQKWFKRNGKTLTYDEDLVEEILDRMEEHDMGARGAAAMLETLIGTAEYDMFANGYKNLHLHKGMFFREEPVFDEQKGKSRDK